VCPQVRFRPRNTDHAETIRVLPHVARATANRVGIRSRARPRPTDQVATDSTLNRGREEPQRGMGRERQHAQKEYGGRHAFAVLCELLLNPDQSVRQIPCCLQRPRRNAKEPKGGRAAKGAEPARPNNPRAGPASLCGQRTFRPSLLRLLRFFAADPESPSDPGGRASAFGIPWTFRPSGTQCL